MDAENTPDQEVAPQDSGIQNEQVAETEISDNPTPEARDTGENWEKRYKDLQSEYTRTSQEKAQLEQFIRSQSQEKQPDVQPLDPDVLPALDNWYQQRRAQEKAQEAQRKAQAFVNKHREELNDPVLDAQVRREAQIADMNGEDINWESALKRAKQVLDERLKPQVKEAQKQGLEEGKELAHKKELAGAIGDTARKQEKSDSEMTSAEYAEKHKLPRMN